MTSTSLLFLCVLLISRESYGVSLYGYHMKIGVPKAQQLLYDTPQTRVAGGHKVTIASAVPYQVGILAQLTSGLQSMCGGSLVSNTRVVTAAHCWSDGQSQAKLFTVVLGVLTIFSGGTRRDTADVVIHPNWDANDITHDIMMVKIASVTFDNNIQAIPLPSIEDINHDFVGMTGTVSGFGRTSDGKKSQRTATSLYQTTVNIISNADCQKNFSLDLHGSHLCTSGTGMVGTCNGDSGGPLTTVLRNRTILVGIVSFGLSEDCTIGNPSIYTSVTAFLDWISANM